MSNGTTLYCRYLKQLTRPLMYPLLAQLVGVILWLVLAYEVPDYLTTYYPKTNIWLLWGAFLVANLPGMLLFMNGFWHYLVWVSALNLTVRELVDTGQCIDPKGNFLRITHRSADYSLIWLFMFAILFVPFGLATLPVAFGATHPEWYVLSLVTAVGIIFVGLLLALVLLVFISLVFQVFAFTPGSAGASLFRSIDLVGQGAVKTLVIIIASVAFTQFIAPVIVGSIFDIAHLTQLMGQGLEFAVRYALDQSRSEVYSLQAEYPFMYQLFHLLDANPHRLAIEVARTMTYTFVSALLLPLGTCWFALLYADLKTRMDLPSSPPKVLEEVGTA